ncbi:tRNA pseudouridine(55) synthase TruB [Desulfosoma caldarium]|nr:tRNA pseudouridine(55) synthase TruB [Desulfosoma caldarium]
MNSLKRSAQRAPSVVVHGVLLVDKPEGWTSHDVVDSLRRRLGVSKMGHTGTLDPFATGLLVLCLGEATRIADLLTHMDKRYIFRMRLGVETDTLDLTGRVTRVYEGPAVSPERLRNTAAEMVGPQMQQVPRYAAVKVQGRRLYEWTRAGKEIEAPRRPVEIYSLHIVEDTWPEISCHVHCSKGTYVRQLAADLGRRLGCGAHVTALRRTESGPFSVHDALPLDALDRMAHDREWMRHVIPLHAALSHLPAVVVTDAAIRNRIRHGQLPETWLNSQAVVAEGHGGPVRLMGPNNVLLALWWPVAQPGQRRLKVFRSSDTFI